MGASKVVSTFQALVMVVRVSVCRGGTYRGPKLSPEHASDPWAQDQSPRRRRAEQREAGSRSREGRRTRPLAGTLVAHVLIHSRRRRRAEDSLAAFVESLRYGVIAISA